jgi:hypothetical protein
LSETIEVVGHIPQQHVASVIPVATAKEAVHWFQKEHPGACVEKIDGAFVVGICEGCEIPLFENDDYMYLAEENIHFCMACKLKKEDLDESCS